MKKNLLFLAALSILTACGGGGGGGGDLPSFGAADVSIDASPRNIDVGDRSTVEVQIRSPHPEGINLKVRFPDAVSYVPESTKLILGKDSVSINPGVRVTESGQSYVVYYLPLNAFGEDERGTLVFELKGVSRGNELKIAVDPDVGSDQSPPFDPLNPEFESEASLQIEVRG